MADSSYPENVSYQESVVFGKEELKRRRKSRLKRTGSEIKHLLESLDYRDPVAIIDPGIGFHTKTLRFFMQRISPHNSEGTEKAGPSKWNKYGHRHTVEAVIRFLSGAGYSIIDGARYEWRAGDFLCVPVFAWHRHVNISDEPAVYVAGVTNPFHKAIGQMIFEDELYPEQWIFAQKGETAMGTLIPGVAEGASLREKGAVCDAERLYLMELRSAHEEEKRRRAGKVLVHEQELVFEDTSLGKMAYVVDPRLGFNVKVISTHMYEILPGHATTVHRHMHEEICYILSGDGLSVIGDAMESWTAGDAIFVPPLEWHEHRNQGKQTARILVHTNRPLTENIGLSLTQHFSGEVKT